MTLDMNVELDSIILKELVLEAARQKMRFTTYKDARRDYRSVPHPRHKAATQMQNSMIRTMK